MQNPVFWDQYSQMLTYFNAHRPYFAAALNGHDYSGNLQAIESTFPMELFITEFKIRD